MTETNQKIYPLSAREFEVVRCIADGLSNAQVAARLGISSSTVASHIEHINQKLKTHNRVLIARWFWRGRVTTLDY